MVGKRVCALATVILLVASGCKKDDAPAPSPPAAGRRVYVLCEGQYGTPTAALSVYLPEKDSVYTDAFGAANAPQWGDVAHSMFLTANEIFICVNNSDRVLVADRASLRLKHSIPVRRPRYIQQLSDSVAVVSSLYSNVLFRLSLNTYTVNDSIILPRANPEGMKIHGSQLYVCPWDVTADHLFVVSAAAATVDSIPVGQAPHTIEVDKAGHAWVLSGNAYEGVGAKLTRINLSTRAVEKTYDFPPTADPVRLSFNPGRDTLYFIGVNYTGTTNNGVYRMRIDAATLPSTPFIQGHAFQYFWAVGVDPGTHHIYVGDPKGFTQKGSVRQYSPDGTLLREFSVGVGPNHFYFD